MTKRFRCYLKDAVVVSLDENTMFLYGEPINDTRFVDWIRTSPIVDIKFNPKEFCTEFETLNSIYRTEGLPPDIISVSEFMQMIS